MTVHKFNFLKELVASLLVIFILIPLIILALNSKNLIYENYTSYDLNYPSQKEYLNYLFSGFGIYAILFLFFNQTPYLFIRYVVPKYIKLTFVKECGIYFLLNCLIVLISGWGVLFYSNPWTPDYFFIIYILILSIIVILFRNFVLNYLLTIIFD